jgi:hypothetical protein
MAVVILLLKSAVSLSSGILTLLLLIAAGVASYGALLVLLKTEELKRLFGMVRERISRH